MGISWNYMLSAFFTVMALLYLYNTVVPGKVMTQFGLQQINSRIELNPEQGVTVRMASPAPGSSWLASWLMGGLSSGSGQSQQSVSIEAAPDEISLLDSVLSTHGGVETNTEYIPRMISGFFHTDWPMYYANSASSTLRNQLMLVGFQPCGALVRVPAADETVLDLQNIYNSTIEEIKTSFGPPDNISYQDILGASDPSDVDVELQKAVAVVNFLKLLRQVLLDGQDMAFIFSDDISPAPAVFWDTEITELPLLLDAQNLGDWGFLILSYHYDSQTQFKRLYRNWRAGLPFSRFAPAHSDYYGVDASLWKRSAVIQALKALLVLSPEIKTDDDLVRLLTSHDIESLMINCGPKKTDCRLERLLADLGNPTTSGAHTGGAADQHEASGRTRVSGTNGYVVQPPLFTRRPIPESVVHKGWSEGVKKIWLQKQQEAANTFKWQAENSEIMENLRAFTRLPEYKQEEIMKSAKEKYIEDTIEKARQNNTLELSKLKELEIIKTAANADPLILLAHRAVKLLPQTYWGVAPL